MPQEIESFLTGFSNTLTQYMGKNYENQIAQQQQKQKMAGELAKEKEVAGYKAQLDLSNTLQTELLKKGLKQGEFIKSDDINKIPGLEFMPSGVDLQPGPVLSFITNMNKTKNKPQGKIPVGLLNKEAELNAQEALLKQLDSMLEKNQAGIKGGFNSAIGSVTRGNFGVNPLGVGGVSTEQAANARNYNQLRKAAAVMAYRTTTGDTRLSDQDAAERGYPLLPDLSEPTKVRNEKMRVIQESFKKAKQANILAQRKAISQSGEAIDLGDDNPYANMSNEEILQALQGQ